MSRPPHSDRSPGDRGSLRNRDLVCFSHDWTGDPLSKTHLMRILAADNRILWVNSIGYRSPNLTRRDLARAFHKLKAFSLRLSNPEPNIFILNPLALPFHGQRMSQVFNRLLLRLQVRHAMRKLGFTRVVNWIFNPPAAVVAGQLGEEAIIYQCVDEYAAFTGVPAASIEQLEAFLLRRADLSIVSSQRLLASRRRLNADTVLVRHGVDFTHFRRALDPATPIPDDIAALPKPVIGFFGLIADWVDLELIRGIADHFSTGSVVLLGKVVTDLSPLAGAPNIHLLGRKPYRELPGYCRAFDVALNPFRINELTLNANPLKVREYLAAGLPVVSTPIPEVAALGCCQIADGLDETIQALVVALNDPGPRLARSERVRGESWEVRVEEIRGHFAAAMGRRPVPR